MVMSTLKKKKRAWIGGVRDDLR